LALDVNPGEGCRPWALEVLAGFPGQEHHCAVSVLEEMLAVMVKNELSCIGVRLEVKLLGNKPKGHVWFVTGEKVSNDI
jgi:hypothetical protein